MNSFIREFYPRQISIRHLSHSEWKLILSDCLFSRALIILNHKIAYSIFLIKSESLSHHQDDKEFLPPLFPAL